MSHLREIMQRLAANRNDAAAATTPTQAPTQLTSPAAGLDLASYRDRLRACSPPMLDYEFTWLHQSLDDLELCRHHPPMEEAAGGSQRVQQLLEQVRACLQALQEECQGRGLTPRRQARSVAVGEHAWEVSHAGIRSSWGLDPRPA
jgi:AcrR family transcriptional regulator